VSQKVWQTPRKKHRRPHQCQKETIDPLKTKENAKDWSKTMNAAVVAADASLFIFFSILLFCLKLWKVQLQYVILSSPNCL
jgi:hypothetical protein